MSLDPQDPHDPIDPPDPAHRRSRRTVLAGVGGLVALGAVGAGLVEADVLPGRARVHRLLGDRSPVVALPSVETGPRLSGEFASKARQGRSTSWVAAWPAGHEPGDKLPLLVTLHGFGDDHRAAFDSLHLDLFAGQAIADGTPPFVIAAVDAGDGYFHERTAYGDSGAMVGNELVPELVRHGVRLEHAEIRYHRRRPTAAQAEPASRVSALAVTDRRHEVETLDEALGRLAGDDDHLSTRRRDLRRPAGSGKSDLRALVLADDCRVDVGEAIDLRTT